MSSLGDGHRVPGLEDHFFPRGIAISVVIKMGLEIHTCIHIYIYYEAYIHSVKWTC